MAIASRASRSARSKEPSIIRAWASAASTVARSTLGSVEMRSIARSNAARALVRSPAARRYRPRRSWSIPSTTRSRRSSKRLTRVSM